MEMRKLRFEKPPDLLQVRRFFETKFAHVYRAPSLDLYRAPLDAFEEFAGRADMLTPFRTFSRSGGFSKRSLRIST